MNVTVFEAINITKKYRNTLALNQVSMSVMQGDIYGFIGENGAGKTTMIRLLTGLAEPTTGKIALFGESNKKLAKQRDRIGCIIESPSLYLDMTAYENLEVQRLQRGIPGKGCIDNALALVGLKDTGKKKAKDFSLGMRQRLALAIALLGNPEFLVLDEPINGLDPTGIIELRNLLKRLNKERGITILISSHILTELHQLANRYGILHEGKLLQEITATELDKRCKKHFSCLSHDLRTPLTSIRGYLQLLSSAPDEKRAEYISALSGKALRLERLIDDFYQISLLEAGQYPFYYEKVELCSLLTEILLDNYSIFSVNGIEPQIEIPNMDIYLNADRKACIRIIQNLIFNAVTSTTNNVVIQLINIADSVQLCIKNPVASIPTEEYSKLLERFYVADVSRSNGTSGQGLYIVKKLLLMMNCTNPIIEIHDHNFMITIDFSPLLIKK